MCVTEGWTQQDSFPGLEEHQGVGQDELVLGGNMYQTWDGVEEIQSVILPSNVKHHSLDMLHPRNLYCDMMVVLDKDNMQEG
jgi:hypothetical protein